MVNVEINQQRISILDATPFVAAGSIEFALFHFEFSSDWDGFTKTAQFTQRQSGSAKTYNKVLEDNECYLPAEITEGVFVINVFGASVAGQRATSGYLCLNAIAPGFIEGGTTPIPPTPDLYAQLLAEIENTCVDLNARSDLQNNILNATQVVTLDEYERIVGVTHSVGGETVRTDVIAYDGDTVTETRTLSTGQSLVIVTNTATLAVSLTWSDGE